ncbi:MAG: hypothetical protein ABI672_11500 [Vicinamibacteria bacterium]
MADRKPFLLRLDERTFLALKRWADDDLRSVNGQVEFLLRRSLEQAGRLTRPSPDSDTPTAVDTEPEKRK